MLFTKTILATIDADMNVGKMKENGCQGRKYIRNLVGLALLFVLLSAPCARAETKSKDPLGDMYTHALNALEACGELDTLEPRKKVRITDIHIDHGLVHITVVHEQEERRFTFDPLFNHVGELLQPEK